MVFTIEVICADCCPSSWIAMEEVFTASDSRRISAAASSITVAPSSAMTPACLDSVNASFALCSTRFMLAVISITDTEIDEAASDCLPAWVDTSSQECIMSCEARPRFSAPVTTS